MSATMPPFDFEGKSAIVTGASSGIGQAIALALGKAGAAVTLVGRSSMDETERLCAAAGVRAQTVAVDLSDLSAFDAVVAAGLRPTGAIDILVNNAGTIRRSDAIDYSEQDWDAVLDVNLKSVFFLSQAVARHMLAAGRGKIVNIASLLSFQGGVRVAAYTASKSGLAGVTRLLACEWAHKGINVNAIAPGYVVTNVTAALRQDPDRNAAILGRIPAGRWGQPDDIAGAVLFLASPAADYVHGAILPVDGGWLAR
jgi:2-dehydro-3-deoxy-D-gluconate 5-dehydrogenase